MTNNGKIIPTFEERVMRNIAKLKEIIASSGFDLSSLTTANKTSIVAAINELK